MLRALVASTNLLLGVVYTGYGVMTIIDLKRHWRTNGVSHFGLAWIAMAFTCGPHHLEHGVHVAISRAGGPIDLFAVLVGLPAGAAWFLLRVEALTGGRGDRFISGTPRWVAALPALSIIYAGVLVGWGATALRDGVHFGPRLVPNILLLGIYFLIGFYLLRTQLANREPLGGWSVSGLALTLVFPTCGLMHSVYALYATAGRYDVEWHGLTIDWLSVPAAVYFVWVVRGLNSRSRLDWNIGAQGVRPATARAVA
jgi:hypothetical protein